MQPLFQHIPYIRGNDEPRLASDQWDLALSFMVGFGTERNLNKALELFQASKLPGLTEDIISRIELALTKSSESVREPSCITAASDASQHWLATSIRSYQKVAQALFRKRINPTLFTTLQETLPGSIVVQPLGSGHVTFKLPVLHYAVIMDNEALVRNILSRDYDINVIGPDERTALFEACASGKSTLVHALLSHGASPSLSDIFNTYPLHMLIFFDPSEMHDVAAALVESGAQVDVHMQPNISWNLGWHGIRLFGAPLHFAVACGNISAVKTLLDLGADSNARVNWKSPLDIAVSSHLSEICRLLVRFGANVTNDPYTGASPLHWIGDSINCSQLGKVSSRCIQLTLPPFSPVLNSRNL